jgi:hypothetical protein
MKIPEKIDLAMVAYPSAIQLASDLLQTVESESSSRQESSGAKSAEVAALQKSLITIASQVWRIASAIIDTESKETKSELSAHEIKKVGNSLESFRETLGGLGIKVIDRLGEPFNAGLPEQVVTEETQEGLSREQIIRTIRPTIMWHQTMVQRGEIDVAVPISNSK